MANSKSRNKQQRSKRAKARQKPPQRQAPRSSSKEGRLKRTARIVKTFFRATWKAFAVIAVLIGFAGAVLQLTARISVSPLSPLNSQNALSTPFTISNDGYLPILNVKYECEISAVGENPTAALLKNSVGNKGVVAAIWPGEKSPVSCNPSAELSAKISRAYVTVAVSYETQFLPGRWDRKFRFAAIPNSDGGFVWIPTVTQ